MTAKLTAYNLLVNFAYSVIPSGGGPTGKSPLVPWEEYQRIAPELEDVQHWDEELKPSLWGVVTGEISCVVVVDIDKPELRAMFDELGLSPHIKTPRQGYHYWFRHPGHPVKTKAGLLPGVDIRGDGGFVNVIGRRKDGVYTVLIPPSPDAIYPWDKLPRRIAIALNGRKPRPTPREERVISEGKRNSKLASLAGAMRRQGLTQNALTDALLAINAAQCRPPLEEREVIEIARSIARYPSTTGKKEYLQNMPSSAGTATKCNKNATENATEDTVYQKDIEEWVRQTKGAWFANEELDRELGYTSTVQKRKRRIALERLAEKGLVQRHPCNNHLTRMITADARLIDFKRAGMRAPLDISLPFDIQKMVNIYPGNIIVLAGAPNTGKTAWMLNVIRLNMQSFPIWYFSSEMGEEELAIRLAKFPGIELAGWNFEARERADNYADVIVPDAINIIDYWEFVGGEAFYRIAEGLRSVWVKLKTGIAIVAIQKTADKLTGRGGSFGLEKPRLYLSMDAGKTGRSDSALRIVKAKNWADPLQNPNGLVAEFKLVNGCEFIKTKDWYRPEE